VMIIMQRYLEMVFGYDGKVLKLMLACLVMCRHYCNPKEVRDLFRNLMENSRVKDIQLPEKLSIEIRNVILEER
jgi:hypothetical protein